MRWGLIPKRRSSLERIAAFISIEEKATHLKSFLIFSSPPNKTEIQLTFTMSSMWKLRKVVKGQFCFKAMFFRAI